MIKIPRLMSPRTTVAGIIIKESKVLLEKRSKKMVVGAGKWCLPGGYIDSGETAEHAIKREIKEEVGLNSIKTKFLFYQDDIFPSFRLYNVALVFSVKTTGKIRTGWEVADTKWFSKQELQKIDLAFNHKKILKKFFSMKK